MKKTYIYIVLIAIFILWVAYAVPSPTILPEHKKLLDSQIIDDEYAFLFEDDDK